MLKRIVLILTILLIVGISLLVTKGGFNDPFYYQKNLDTRVGGPFEASNSTSRYALTISLADRTSPFFPPELASFGAPDIVHYKGNFFSIFLPGLSILALPFYKFGELFGLPQIGAYSVNQILTLIIFILIVVLSKKVGASKYAGIASAVAFLFGSNALAYSLTFTQHTLSTALLLFGVILVFSKRSILTNVLFGLVFGFAATVDVPNVIMFIPLCIYLFLQHFEIKLTLSRLNFKASPILLVILLGFIPFISGFLLYNQITAGTPLKMGQTIGRSNYPPPLNAPKYKISIEDRSPFESKLALNTRNMVNGLYTLIISDERGVFYYSPFLILGIIGLILYFRRSKGKGIGIVLLSSAGLVLLTYAMFDDPWGGWSFGPRYMIPLESVLAVFTSLVVSKLFRKPLLLILIFPLIFLSFYINFLGALTTTAVPPKQEADYLVNPIPHNYEYNIHLVKKGFSSSLIYNLFFIKNMNSKDYWEMLIILALIAFSLPLILGIIDKRK